MKENSSVNLESIGNDLRTNSGPVSLPKIAGVVPFTSVDFPGKHSAVAFLQGCHWRCDYCHNTHLWPLKAKESVATNDFFHFLEKRKKLLDAVVISGGEPLIHTSLLDFILKIRDYGYKIGLHTGGDDPKNLYKILPHVDWIGFDFKAPFQDYEKITHNKGSGQRAFESAQLILSSSIDYEFRTTLHPIYHTPENVIRGVEQLVSLKVKNYALQEFRNQGCKFKILTQSHCQTSQIILSKEFLSRIGPGFEMLTVRKAN